MSPLASQPAYHPASPYWKNNQRAPWPTNPYGQQQYMNMNSMQQQQFLEQPQQQPQQQQYPIMDHSTQLRKATSMVKVEYPIVYHMIREQQNQIEEQKRGAEQASKQIALLQKEISSLWDDKKKEVDRIPPVIHVGKVVGSSCDDDTSGLDSTKKRFSQITSTTDVVADMYDSLPLKKRMRRQKPRPDFAKAMATLQAATSPSFAHNGQLRTSLFWNY